MKLSTWAREQGISYKTAGVCGKWKQETGSGLHGRQALLRIFRNPQVQVIVVEHRDRLMPFGFAYLEAALAAQGRRVMVLDGS